MNGRCLCSWIVWFCVSRVYARFSGRIALEVLILLGGHLFAIGNVAYRISYVASVYLPCLFASFSWGSAGFLKKSLLLNTQSFACASSSFSSLASYFQAVSVAVSAPRPDFFGSINISF